MFFMDDLKLFGKTEKEIDSLVQIIQQSSEDINMEFGISKCAVVSLKRWTQEEMQNLDRDTWKLLIKYRTLHPNSNVLRL